MKRMFALLALLTSFMLSLHVRANQLEAHVHGTALMQVAVDANILTVSFSSPLDNLLGFEHKPRNQAQVAQVKQMIKQFYKPSLFIPTKVAQCKLQTVDLDSLVIKKKQAKEQANTYADKAPEHADLDAVLTYQCQQIAKLRDLRVGLFKAFPNLHQVNAEVVSARGQTAKRLTPNDHQVVL